MIWSSTAAARERARPWSRKTWVAPMNGAASEKCRSPAHPRELELAVPLSALAASRSPAVLDFKWADNIQQTGDWSDFTLNGDAAPDDRFNYRAITHDSSK